MQQANETRQEHLNEGLDSFIKKRCWVHATIIVQFFTRPAGGAVSEAGVALSLSQVRKTF